MQRNDDGILEEEDDFVVLRSGGRCNKLKTGAKKGESRSEYEWRGPCAIVQIIELPHTEGKEEDP
jgi:hypothetical protein